MKCDVCGAEMEKGFALNSATRDGAIYIAPPAPANHETIGFIECHKCPECGRSVTDEELKDKNTE